MQDDKPLTDQVVTLDDLDRAPEIIPPSSTDQPVTTADYADKLARVGTDRDNLKAQVDAETTRTLNDLIRPSADRAFKFMWSYCGGVFLLLVLHGFEICNFELPASTLDYLVGSTAVTVIGLVGMVLTGIFVGARK